MDDQDIAEEVYGLLLQVPRGRVTTYGALAEALGAREAARLVGELMARNPYAPDVACHRVVRSDGTVGKFSSPRGVPHKVELLAGEGVTVSDGRVVDFEDVLFRDFVGPRPLADLRKYQLSLLPKLSLRDEREPHSTMLAVDVAYTADGAFAAGALQGLREEGPGPSVEVHLGICFPYIPTFLAFREVPAVKAVLSALPSRPGLLLIDGNGTLHPHGIGIASQAGIELDIPTIGVAKSLLCGEVREPPSRVGASSPVTVGGEVRGSALRVSERPGGVVYVSPGHLVSPGRAVELVSGLVREGRVEPLRRAHLLATESAKRFKSGGPVALPG